MGEIKISHAYRPCHLGKGPRMRQNIGDLRPYLVKVLTPAEKVNGTGFFCNPEGFILTCYHVVKPWLTKSNEVFVVHKNSKLRATLRPDFSTEEGDIAVLQLDVSTEYKEWGFLPLDTYWRVEPEDKLQSFGYPQGKKQFAKSGIPIAAEVGGLTHTEVDKVKVYPIAGLNLGNVDGGYSGAPLVNHTTQKVIGLIHAKHHEHQAFVVPLEPLFKRWADLRSFHDIFRQIREYLAKKAQAALQERLKETEFIPPALEQGEIPDKKSSEQAERAGPLGRRWERIDVSNLLRPSGKIVLSSDVGTGKTTFLYWLTKELLDKTAAVPVSLSCSKLEKYGALHWENLKKNLIDSFRVQFLERDLDEFFGRAFQDRHVVFLCDGLDQIKGGYSEFAKTVFEIADGRAVLITSRPSAVLAFENEAEILFLRLKLYGPWEFIGPPWAFVFAVEVDPQDPRTVYTALGEGQGVFRSDDGGLSWTPKSVGLTNRNVMDIAVSRHDGTVLAGTRNGLWVSKDRGDTWSSKHGRYRGMDVIRVVLSPHEPKFLLAGTLKQGGSSIASGTIAAVTEGSSPLKASDSANAGHLHITWDDGATWATFPLKTVNGACVACDDSRLVYVASADGGLLRTRDGFETYEHVHFPGKQPLCVALAPNDSKVVLVGTLSAGLYQSFDGGDSWEKVAPVGDVQVSQVDFARTNSKHILAATRAGVFESLDAGREWRPANDGLFYRWCMSVTTLDDGAVLCGTSGGGVYRRPPGQTNWVSHNDGFPPAAGLVLASGGGRLLFAGTPVGLLKSLDAGATWKFVALEGEPVTAIALPATRGRHRAGRADRGGLYVSYDGGESVQDSPTAGRPPLVIYIGTRRGNVYRSRDAGGTWEKLASPKGTEGDWPKRSVRALAVAAGAPDILYVVVERAGIIRSTDGGVTWTLIGVETCGELVNSLFLSPHDARLLYAGTQDRGLCVSRDGGDTWRVASELKGDVITEVVEPLQSPELAFALTVSRAVYRSMDRGRSWKLLRLADKAPDKAAKWATLAVSVDGVKLALGSSEGAYFSRNGGQNWERVPGGALGMDYYVNRFLFADDASGTLYASMTQGIFKARMA